MKMDSIAPAFCVANVDDTAAWYASKLGFKAYGFPDKPPYVFAILEKDGVEIFLQKVEDFKKEPMYHRRSVGVWDAYIRTTGVKALFEQVKDAVKIVQPLRKQPYGDIEFEIEDCNGYVLVFSGDVDQTLD